MMALVLEQPRQMFGPSTRQSILAAESLSDLVAVASGDALPLPDHSDDIAGLCVALATFERTSAARLRRMEAAIRDSVDLRN